MTVTNSAEHPAGGVFTELSPVTELRKSLDLTARQFAELLGLAACEVSAYECGSYNRVRPSLHRALSDAGIPSDDLATKYLLWIERRKKFRREQVRERLLSTVGK